MRFKTKNKHLGVKEDGILLNLNLSSSKEIMYSDMQKVHIEVKKLAPLYKTLLIMVTFFTTTYLVVVLHLDILIFLCLMLLSIIGIIKKEFKSYKLEIYLKNGEIVKNDIPSNLRKEVIKSLYEIRKGIFYNQISNDNQLNLS